MGRNPNDGTISPGAEFERLAIPDMSEHQKPDDPRPNASVSTDGPAPAKSRRSRHPLNLSLGDLPEMELFESDEQRDRALHEIGRESGSPGKLDWWIAIGILLTIGIGAWWLLRQIRHWLTWPGWLEELLQFAILISILLLVLRGLHRWGSRAELRQKLLQAGIPVCLGCGYSLRGQPSDSQRCPECGRVIDERGREVLAATRGSDPMC